MSNNLIFEEMLDNLLKINAKTWGEYQITQDILFNKIKKDDYEYIIDNSLKAGNYLAQEIKNNDIEEICYENKISIKNIETKPGTKKLLFGQFTTPNKIVISITPIDNLMKLIKKTKYKKLFNKSDVYNVILAHELFHYFEIKNRKTIFTQNYKICLWKLFNYKHQSTLRCTSEIAAMKFAKELTNVDYFPNILDVLLLYSFNKKAALNIYNKVLNMELQLVKTN